VSKGSEVSLGHVLLFVTHHHANASRARYCYSTSVHLCPSIQCQCFV